MDFRCSECFAGIGCGVAWYNVESGGRKGEELGELEGGWCEKCRYNTKNQPTKTEIQITIGRNEWIGR